MDQKSISIKIIFKKNIDFENLAARAMVTPTKITSIQGFIQQPWIVKARYNEYGGLPKKIYIFLKLYKKDSPLLYC